MRVINATILDPTHLELKEALSAPQGAAIEIAVPETAAATEAPRPTTGYRNRENEWRRSHPEALLSFAGQWVVLENEEIVVHGDDPARLVELAREKGIEVPYVFYVDPPRPGVVRIGL